MKTMHLLLLTLTSMMTAAFGDTLKPGNNVSLEALRACAFLQGDAPTSWEPGKLYFIECWSTTCGPCIEAMPHVKELHDKYHDKGLRVIGMNIHGDDPVAVKHFLAKKAGLMTYPVALAQEDGKFDKEWVEAMGIRGIPHMILVRDGVLLCHADPRNVSDQVMEELLEGGELAAETAKWLAEQEESKKNSPEEDVEEAAMVGKIQEFIMKISKRSEELTSALVTPENESKYKSDMPALFKLIEASIAARKDWSDEDKAAWIQVKWGVALSMNDSDVIRKVLGEAWDLSPKIKSPLPLHAFLMMFHVKRNEAKEGVVDARQIVLDEMNRTGQGAGATLVPGAKISPEALKALQTCQFIQGEGPSAWEAGKVYMLDCWSTECGSCVAARPHVNDLHTKFGDRGLRVISMNITDKDLQGVREFVKENASNMTYPVAFAGEEGPFVLNWVDQVRFLMVPKAMLIRDGKIIALVDASRLTEEMVSDLLAGGEKAAAVEATLKAGLSDSDP